MKNILKIYWVLTWGSDFSKVKVTIYHLISLLVMALLILCAITFTTFIWNNLWVIFSGSCVAYTCYRIYRGLKLIKTSYHTYSGNNRLWVEM